ncbi:hypothetical protein [Clostridium porci]|uniref:hypothetical protein n=1 Tax=Clostridium porci TaxID=2605778 RepID=UPI0012B34B03|nr:hypothetical protein [Clostridium porci]
MAYGYMRPDPKEAFRNAIRFYGELIDIAVDEGYTEEQAMELLKVWALVGIESNVGQIS